MTKSPLEIVEDALTSTSSELQFSSMARAGDPMQHADMVHEATQAGRLERALVIIRGLRKVKGLADALSIPLGERTLENECAVDGAARHWLALTEGK